MSSERTSTKCDFKIYYTVIDYKLKSERLSLKISENEQIKITL